MSELLAHVASFLQAELEGEYTSQTLAEAAVKAVISHLGAPTAGDLTSLANSFHPQMESQSVAYLVGHFRRMLAESLT